ncbi:MAG: HlyD family efflux transporter periplasmic adaptor subunit [Leptolyngbyaceae cyanobacterium SU_3_3]|nr:HlyD family efflux transporter periplasmic adaptor subunit [Leptolyngbyaceae cyanobacterium SU_3_3]
MRIHPNSVAKISNLETMRVAANSKLKQRYVYAPTSGVVSALHVRNVGEVVQPGQPIADIAPSHKPLVLSAILPNQEAGFVKVGMPVQIKFDAYPYQDYGMVSGSVVSHLARRAIGRSIGSGLSPRRATRPHLHQSKINKRFRSSQGRPPVQKLLRAAVELLMSCSIRSRNFKLVSTYKFQKGVNG